MREIKFRAWDKSNKSMLEGFKSYILLDFTGDTYKVERKYNGEKILTHPGEIILMQYTGLKDKNWKEIYEGDIFQVAKNKKYIVDFCSGKEFEHEWYGGSFVIKLNDETFFPFDEFSMKHGEVIGNIYENPELLNGTIEANKKTGLTDDVDADVKEDV